MESRLEKAAAQRLCYNCGEPAAARTDDHIPPKALFPKGTSANLITVPSCYQCNQQMSLDDQYFATVLAGRWNDNPTQSTVFEQKVSPQLQNEEFDGLRKMLLARSRPIWLPAGDGFVETGILNVNMDRIKRVLRKIVRGLYYHHRGVPLPTADAVSIYFDPKDWRPELANWARTHVVVEPDVFEYLYAFPGPESSLSGLSGWVLRFYRKTIAVAFTIPPDLAPRIPPRKAVSR